MFTDSINLSLIWANYYQYSVIYIGVDILDNSILIDIEILLLNFPNLKYHRNLKVGSSEIARTVHIY